MTVLVWLFGTSKYVNVLCNVQEIEQSTDILYSIQKKEDHLSSIYNANHSHSYSGQVPIIQCGSTTLIYHIVQVRLFKYCRLLLMIKQRQ